MDRRAVWVLVFVFGGLFVCLFGFLFLLLLAVQSEGAPPRLAGGSRVGVVEVKGAIMDSKDTLEQLREFEQASNVKAVIVRVDSPGGAVGPSQEIYRAILRLREIKPVVTSMGSVAASGGFYVASAGERVFANPGTLTGSIGVIMQLPRYDGLLDWAKIEMRVVTSGEMKDSGSPFREMTREERALFKSVADDVHRQFIEDVATGRSLTYDQVATYADGRVFTGRQAHEWKLVDELGGLHAAALSVAETVGIEGFPKLVYAEKDKGLMGELFGQQTNAAIESAAAFFGSRLSQGAGPEYRMAH